MAVTSREEFRRQVLDFWVTAIEVVGGSIPPTTATWTGLEKDLRCAASVHGIEPQPCSPPDWGWDGHKQGSAVCHRSRLYRTGGRWKGHLYSAPFSTYVRGLPHRTYQPFLLLELADLQPSGVYGEHHRPSEELVELTPGQYVERGVWDDGYYGHDDRGREIPLPDESRLIVRWLNGKILFVAKGSLWNGTPATYRGQHNNMTSTQIRQAIEHGLAQRSE